MENFSNNDISKIKSTIGLSIDTIKEALNWSNNNLKYDSHNKLNSKLKNTINILNKIDSNINSKPVIAVFGASQVGKSYLIKNLLSENNTPFYISNGSEKYDFLKDINPPGTGAESTGVVTRFTIDKNEKYSDFPIKVKLLSPKDLLTVSLDSFYLDSKKITTIIEKNKIENHLIELNKLVNDNYNQNNFTEFEVLEVKEYFKKHLNKFALHFQNFEETLFFEKVGEIIHKINPQDWVLIFEILWNKNKYFSELFTTLIKSLDSLDFSRTVYLKFEEILREKGNEILDVKRINEIYKISENTTIKSDNGNSYQIQPSSLAALIEELILTIPEELAENKQFLNNSDLLDFPGARSRKAIEIEEINNEAIPEMLLRGKVSYLFNKYSDDFNINNLLFCTNDQQLSVNELPYLLENWINNNIGTNPQERLNSLNSSKIPPLFIVFTFFNNQLKFDSTNDINFETIENKLEYKWNTRFNTFFENELVTPTRNWHNEWVNNSCFKNFYLLRDFKYSNDFYLGFEVNGLEKEFNPIRTNYFKELENSFVNHNFVKKHFNNPLESWNNTTSINSNGVDLIINNLSKVSNNTSKINRYITKINELTNELVYDLKQHIHTDDINEIRARNMKDVNEILFSFSALLVKNIYAFNDLIMCLSVDSKDVFNHLNKNMTIDVGEKNMEGIDESNILITQFPELKNVQTLQEAIIILKKALWLTTDDEVLSLLENHKIDKNIFVKSKKSKSKSEIFTDLTFEYWKENITKNELEKFSYFLKNGITKNSILFLIDFYEKIINQRNIKSKYEQIVNNVISNIESNKEITIFLSETFTLIINDIIYNFDKKYIQQDEINELEKFNLNLKYYNNTTETVTDEQLKQLFEDTEESIDVQKVILGKYNKWIDLLRIATITNSGFVTYDEAANNQLKSILTKFQPLNLN